MPTNAHHASLSKVKDWFANRGGKPVRRLNESVIQRMLCNESSKRPNAESVSQLLEDVVSSDTVTVNVIACSKCCLDLWVDPPAGDIRSRTGI